MCDVCRSPEITLTCSECKDFSFCGEECAAKLATVHEKYCYNVDRCDSEEAVAVLTQAQIGKGLVSRWMKQKKGKKKNKKKTTTETTGGSFFQEAKNLIARHASKARHRAKFGKSTPAQASIGRQFPAMYPEEDIASDSSLSESSSEAST